MIQVPVFEAKTRLSELLTQVQQGQEVTITRHGEPMARLVSVANTPRSRSSRARQVDAAFEALTAIGAGACLDVPLRTAIEEGRD